GATIAASSPAPPASYERRPSSTANEPRAAPGLMAGAGSHGSAHRGLLPDLNRGDALVQPVGDHCGDLEIVLLMHQEVAISADADVLKSDEIMLHARLCQKVRVAVRSRGLERRFADQEQDWDGLEIDELARRLFLHPAPHQVRLVRLLLLDHVEARGGSGRFEGQRRAGDAVRLFEPDLLEPVRRADELQLVEWR